MTGRWALVLHGGAGVSAGRTYDRAEACLARLVIEGAERLRRDDRALDVVEAMTAAMEDSGLFVAGRGSAPNALGQVELDASLMDGRTGRAGAVAAVQGIASPIALARLIMERSPHVLLAGEGAARFGRSQGCVESGDLSLWLTTPDGFDPGDLSRSHGTVGAVALDRRGRLAAATSTGGTYGALPGRVGDSASIGAGAWADDAVAVSCTGEGEAFIKAAAASGVAARVTLGGQSPSMAAKAVLARVRALGGDGGLIVVSRSGEMTMAFDGEGMKRASASSSEAAKVGSVGPGMREARCVLARRRD